MSQVQFKDLREYIEACKKIDDYQIVEGADWDQEIGALTETTAELFPNPPMIIFDKIKGYPEGYRVVSLPIATQKRAAFALGLPLDKSKLETVRLAVAKLKGVKPIPPVEVDIDSAPVMENVIQGDDIDMFKFPVPQFHLEDGGRYIGTGDTVINRDPETGYVNMGTYRIQVHEKNLLGLWISPGNQGRQILERYWERGESCPIVATFGVDPLTFMASYTKVPFGVSELDFVGGLRGEPLEVIKGPLTGLPIPAWAEIAIEGEVPPPNVESRNEGPFGEWPGYYSGGSLGTGEPQPVIRVKAVYHRNNPIIHNQAPLWPGAEQIGLDFGSGLLWDQLESIGVQDIKGVYCHNRYFIAVSIRQRFGGHAKQVGFAVVGCAQAARHGRYIVIVDEDIDPSNMKEVLWAMQTRINPATDIDVFDGTWDTPLDPAMPPSRRDAKDYTNSRAIFYAVRPFHWREEFPKVSRTKRELRDKTIEKYMSQFKFPSV